ncbi:hypothetical protein ACMDCR_29510 [Labrys okinawensis]|uniref:hypothetical protein n=1 Tax=Labrys okinawensis TaxID=346911 RepID=UPI0039BD9341
MQNHTSFLAQNAALRAFLAIVSVLCAVTVGAGAAMAQQPTAAQRNAIKSACRGDFIANCSGVTPGGLPALQCLQKHNDSLSPACQKAIGALKGGKSSSAAPMTPAPQPAAAPAAAAPKAAPTTAQRNAIKAACRSDFMSQCSGVTPGGTAALSCLQQHSASLSASCQQAVAAIGGAPAGAAAPSTATPAAAPAMPMRAFSPREEIFIVRQSCGPDFRAYCGAVPLGGGRAIACLRRNAARLSPSCQQVLASGR